MEITKDIRYIGVDDHDIDLFEGQYDVSENGMAYNSYVILGDKIAVADSVDGGFVDEWLGNLEAALDGRTPDYLVVHHMEPDHSAGIAAFMERYPQAQIVASVGAFRMMVNYFGTDYPERKMVVKDGDVLDLGGLDRIEAYSSWASTQIDYDFVVMPGQSLGQIWGYVSDGRYPASDFTWTGSSWQANEGVLDNSHIAGNGWGPGAVRFRDLGGDPDAISAGTDRTVLGCTLPKATGGFSLAGRIKGFDFNANFTYTLGNKILNVNKAEYTSTAGYRYQNLLTTMDSRNRWQSIDAAGQRPGSAGRNQPRHFDVDPHERLSLRQLLHRRGRFVPASQLGYDRLLAARRTSAQNATEPVAHLRHGDEPLLLDRLLGLRPRSRHPALHAPYARRRLFALSQDPGLHCRT